MGPTAARVPAAIWAGAFTLCEVKLRPIMAVPVAVMLAALTSDIELVIILRIILILILI
jgi:hypothetical protein